jgi:hypothetical protein
MWVILEYFCCMIGNTVEAWSCCSSRSDGDMLRVWFSCSPFVPEEHSVKLTAPLQVCTKDKQHAICSTSFLVSVGMKRTEIYRQLADKYGQRSIDSWLTSMDRDLSTVGWQVWTEIYRQLADKYGQNCLPQWSMYQWIEMFKSSRTNGWCRRTSTCTNQQNMARAQAMILGNCRVNYCGNCWKTGHKCCSSLVQTCSVATTFTPHSLGANGLQFNIAPKYLNFATYSNDLLATFI